MTTETKVGLGIALGTFLVLGGLVWFGGRGGNARDLPADIKTAADQADPSFPVGDLANEGDATSGAAAAAVTLVEFSDFECPYCQALHPEIVKLRAEFSDAELRLVFRHLPIVEIHAEAYPAARAAQAATAQNKGMEFIDALFTRGKLGESLYKKVAADLGLDIDRFDTDRQNDRTVAWRAYRARYLFKERGLTIATPQIFINGEPYQGQRTVAALAAAVRDRL